MRNENETLVCRTLNPYQLGWMMARLECELSTREFLCGKGTIRWHHWDVGRAYRMPKGDWRVELFGETDVQRKLQLAFSRMRVGS